MEENKKVPGGWFDDEKLLVDREQANPFQEDQFGSEVHTFPYENKHSTGYIRYILQEKSLVILDCVIVAYKQ